MPVVQIAQPPSQPSHGPERARDPGERRAAVRVGPVHVEVRRRDQEHRHERREQDRRRLEADDDATEPITAASQ